MDRYERQRLYTLLAFLLLLLAGALGWFFWSKSKAYLKEKERVAAMYDSLSAVKAQLEVDLDSLQFSYDALHAENTNLQGSLASVTQKLKGKDAIIAALKAENTRNIDVLRSQITTLQTAKTEFETIIGLLQQENLALKSENSALKGKNQELTAANQQLNNEVSDLAKKLENQIRATHSATFRASSFRVEVENRRDKLTVRARKARELAISFDLSDVPQPYQGQQKLYLVISDENGKPISSKENAVVTIDAPAQKVNITAQASKLVVLADNQRINFNFDLDDKLKKGHYVVAIYCDKGLLGATSLRLR